MRTKTLLLFLFKIGIHFIKTEQSLQGMKLQKKQKKIKAYRKSLYKEPAVYTCLLILDLKPFRL